MRLTASVTKSLALLWVSHLILDFFTGIWPIYKTMAQIDLAQAGLIAGLSGFIGEIIQLLSGYFSDRGFRKKLMIAGLVLSSSILCITFTRDITNCFLILVVLMLGSGLFHPAAVGFASSLSSENKSRAILFFSSGGEIGLAISQLTFISVFQIYNGHITVLLIPLVLVLLVTSFYPFSQKVPSKSISLKEFVQPIFRAKKSLLFLYFIQVANYTLMAALIFLLPDLMSAKGCHQWLCLGGGHLSFFLGSAVLMTPMGYLCDKYGHKSILIITLSCSIALLYMFLSQPTVSLTGSILFLAALGGCMRTINPMLVAWANRLVPDSPSTVSGLMMGCAWCIAHLGATWAGLIARSVTVEPIITTFYCMGFLLVLALLLILRVPQSVEVPSAEVIKVAEPEQES